MGRELSESEAGMEILRKYGRSPFELIVIHGGPGAPGSMQPVACELAAKWGVLEPLQTASSLEGQIRELVIALQSSGSSRPTLIGWSWGAMLGFIFAARYPEKVKKLILIGSAVYDEKYAAQIEECRLKRLEAGARRDAQCLLKALNDPASKGKDALLKQLGRLFLRTDNLDPMVLDAGDLEVRYDVYEQVWSKALKMRRNGELLEMGKRIECPVVAIHGDYDPHPAEGIQKPLSSVLRDFRFIPIRNCGHQPWIERQAKDTFYRILKEEIAAAG
jgi:pimeloyl-ACP methyl ester carboxylesterase